MLCASVKIHNYIPLRILKNHLRTLAKSSIHTVEFKNELAQRITTATTTTTMIILKKKKNLKAPYNSNSLSILIQCNPHCPFKTNKQTNKQTQNNPHHSFHNMQKYVRVRKQQQLNRSAVGWKKRSFGRRLLESKKSSCVANEVCAARVVPN